MTRLVDGECKALIEFGQQGRPSRQRKMPWSVNDEFTGRWRVTSRGDTFGCCWTSLQSKMEWWMIESAGAFGEEGAGGALIALWARHELTSFRLVMRKIESGKYDKFI